MKLKRCPNSHYYDGDKYDKCPHCNAAAEPAPPKPVMEPAPQPEPKPEPQPIPQPVPQPAPQPTPQPVPQPESQPTPQPVPQPVQQTSQHTWVCNCGAENNGRFCFMCGTPKPEPQKSEPLKQEDQTWKCSKCGTVNTGRFCYDCGERKPEAQIQPTTPQAVPQPTPQPEPQPAPQPKAEVKEEKSLTESINESRFTGTMEEAKSRTKPQDDDGVTQVIFDEIDYGLVLAWLVVKNTSSKGKVFPITTAKCTIGRADQPNAVDIDLKNDRAVSRGAQAVIVYDPLNKKFFLTSSGGKTYIYVNKEMLLDHRELKAYDIIRAGETDLVFVPLCCEKFAW